MAEAPAAAFTLQRSWSVFSAPAYRNRGNRPSIRLTMRLAYVSNSCWTAILPAPSEPHGCDTRPAYRRTLLPARKFPALEPGIRILREALHDS